MLGRRTALALVLTGALALGACSAGESVDLGGGASAGGGGGANLVVAIAGEPDQLDPHMTSSYFSFEVLENVYDTLVQPDADLEMQPALAESWETSEDQLTWTFHLREGVTFHDGTPLTADDVVYSYNRIIDGELANAYRFGSVEKVTAADELTVEIALTAPAPNLLSSIGGFKGMAIVLEENVESGDIKNKPIGTGPFAFDAYSTGDSISLTANADYWGGAPEIAGVNFRFISEATTALADLQAGEIHWTDSIPEQQVASLTSNPDVEVGKVPSNDYWYLAPNGAKAPYSDARVRQAIAWAIDRDAITQAATYGNGTTNQLAIPETSAWYSDYAPYSRDTGKAQQLLQDAGISDLDLDLMVTTQYPETVQAAQVIAANLAEIGITVNIRTVDFATWLDEQALGNFDMLLLGWLGNIDPDDFYYNQHHSEGASNAQKYANSEVDALLEEARGETDTDKRRDLYATAAAQIADDASYIYLYNPDVVQAWSPKVTGYEARGDRAIRFADVSLEE